MKIESKLETVIPMYTSTEPNKYVATITITGSNAGKARDLMLKSFNTRLRREKEYDEVIVCSAILVGDLIIPSVRHSDPLTHAMVERLGLLRSNEVMEAEQGFVTSKYRFVTREEAWIIAEAADQIVRRVGGDGKRLYSENLW
jgi:hypothetical protein